MCLFCLSCSVCPVLPILFACHGLFCLSRFTCPVLPVPHFLSLTTDLDVILWLLYPGYPVLFCWPVLAVLSSKFYFGITFLTSLLWQSCPACHPLPVCSVCPVLPVRICLSRPAYPILPVPFCLSFLPVSFCLSTLLAPLPPVPFCLSCSACTALPVLF